MKKFILFVAIFTSLAVSNIAQECGYGDGILQIFDEKEKPIVKFKVDFYELGDFEWKHYPKVIRVEFCNNCWDVVPDSKTAKKFIKSARTFSYKWENDEKGVFYKGNTYNYITIENGGRLALARISAKGYKDSYLISPFFSGCYYQNSIVLKKKRKFQF